MPSIKKPYKFQNPTQDDMKNADYLKYGDRPYIIPFYPSDELWEFIPYENLKPQYYVSTYGRVFSKLTGCILRDRFTTDGYKIITLDNKDGTHRNYLIHRLVADVFSPFEFYDTSLNNHQVNHIDTDKTNNHITNLEWCNRLWNTRHAHTHHLYDIHYGSNNHFATINEEIAIKICEGLEKGLALKEVCKYAGLPVIKTYIEISRFISKRQSWKHISKNYNF